VEGLLRGANSGDRPDQSMQAMIREAEKTNTIRNPRLRDAALIASAQRIEHYEIAIYGTLATWKNRRTKSSPWPREGGGQPRCGLGVRGTRRPPTPAPELLFALPRASTGWRFDALFGDAPVSRC
jgi:hypothetical protein